MKLHLGSGKVKLNGWLNVDLDAPEADMHLDLRAPLPFEDQSVTYIFNEHFIEHIAREEAVDLLKESYRVLKNGGVLRLSTPNLKFIVVTYLSRKIGEWGELWQPANPCLLMNEGMRLWGHQFVYDAEELVRTLSEAGFQSVKFVNWGESAIDELVGLETRPFHNELIVEALKDDGIETTCGLMSEYIEDEPWLDSIKRAILQQVKLSERIIAHQAAHIARLEQTIADKDIHIARFEQTIADKDTHIAKLDIHIADLGAHIADLDAHVNSLEQTIASQAAHILNVETVLIKLRSSWYEKLKATARKLRH